VGEAMNLLLLLTLVEIGLGAVAVVAVLRDGAEIAKTARECKRIRREFAICRQERESLKKELDEVYRLSNFGKVLMNALKENKIRIVPVGEKCEHIEVVPGKILCVRRDKVVDLFSGEEVGEAISIVSVGEND